MDYIRTASDILSLASSLLFIWTMIRSYKQKQVQTDRGAGKYVENVFGSDSSSSGSESGEDSGDSEDSEDSEDSIVESESEDVVNAQARDHIVRLRGQAQAQRDHADEMYHKNNSADDDNEYEENASVEALDGHESDQSRFYGKSDIVDLIDINSKIGVLLDSGKMWEESERTPLFPYTELPQGSIGSEEEVAPIASILR